MTSKRKADYHIHYFADKCAHNEMTLANIDAEAARLGLEEICVLKHYSSRMPNGEKEWVHWNKIDGTQFCNFLSDIRAFQSLYGIKILAGVETELLNDKGEINIDSSDTEKLDSASLSVHWFPEMSLLKASPLLYPGDIGKVSLQAADLWLEQINDIGAEKIIESYVLSYAEAIQKNSKVKVLAHMGDGLDILREYKIGVDKLSGKKLVELMEPLMKVCAKNNTLWEIANIPVPVSCEFILKRASELGVLFCATADAHFLNSDGWSHLYNHAIAENYIEYLGLAKGFISVN